jgi:hypothetical protein
LLLLFFLGFFFVCFVFFSVFVLFFGLHITGIVSDIMDSDRRFTQITAIVDICNNLS